MPCFRIICILVLLGLPSCSFLMGKAVGWKLSSKKLPADNRMGEAKLIGVIELVNPEQNYVLINCEQRLNIPAGTEIVSQGADGSKTKLKVTPERKGNYITADITEGTPQLRDIVLYKVKPGDVPAPAPATVSASGAVVPLTPVMQADVIPPLDAPFQPIAPLKPSPAPTQPPANLPTEEPAPDLSKLPPVIR
ncbi:hypothetical protein [Prosthecobacter sp.]|uniref:hypothetical protein n=1 Tax=Prosthecobacter sp. TaxID=1965333 RepID=UPI002AB97242|nr:hypothetical protein [Prosthecobacter sp.]MDZ4405602.1 hypothetical protein [Prosthecobacter sp.]